VIPGTVPPEEGSNAPDAPEYYDAATLARLVLEATNDARRVHLREPLRPDPALARVARAHSADLARSGLTGHTGSDGSSPADRAARAGVRYDALGENVFRGPLYTSRTRITGPEGTTEHYLWAAPEDLAHEAVQGWLESPGHRANLLNPVFDRAGVGVAFDGELRWVLTMDYAD
jgi:uncharacterized protein YkwD